MNATEEGYAAKKCTSGIRRAKRYRQCSFSKRGALAFHEAPWCSHGL